MKPCFPTFCLGLALFAPLHGADTTYVRFSTSLGNVDVQLLSDEAPKNVANFLTYVDSGAYTNSIFHRSVPGFVIQGGGFDIVNNAFTAIPANAPVVNEFKVSNTRGTMAMAKTSDGPDTATNQWFFSEADNSANLDSQNGGFTVFAVIANAASVAVMDKLAAVPVPNPPPFGPPFDALPIMNYTGPNNVMISDLVFVNSVTRLPASTASKNPKNFALWQALNFSAAQLSVPLVSGPEAVPLGDGVPNLLKYVYHINPAQAMTAADRAALPVLGTTVAGSGTRYLTLTYRQNATMSGVKVTVQTSTDLKTWTTVAKPAITKTGTDAVTGDPIEQVKVPVSGGKGYIRLDATLS